MATQQSHPIRDRNDRGFTGGATVTSESGLRERGRWHWLVPVAVFASSVAWLCGVVSGRVHGDVRIELMVAGAVFTAVAAGVPLWQQARTARARTDAVLAATRARAAMRLALEDALDPYAVLLVQIAAAKRTERDRLRGEATQLALTSIAQLGVPEVAGAHDALRLRVCLFLLSKGPPRRLTPHSYAGRAGQPTLSIEEGSREARVLFTAADDGWCIVHDTATTTAVWWDEERAYRTYAAGPVPGRDGAIGVLTIDALNPGDLDEIDLPLIGLIAHLLGHALQL